MPAADRVISLSDAMTADFRKYENYPISQVRMIYHGVSDKFRVETDGARLARAREFTWERTARETLAVLKELA